MVVHLNPKANAGNVSNFWPGPFLTLSSDLNELDCFSFVHNSVKKENAWLKMFFTMNLHVVSSVFLYLFLQQSISMFPSTMIQMTYKMCLYLVSPNFVCLLNWHSIFPISTSVISSFWYNLGRHFFCVH